MSGADATSLAQRLAQRLAERRCRIVFAESCTAGLIAATLAAVPGISRWLCGSAVTYREATKQTWLGVSEQTLAQFTAVSAQVAQQMAWGVLEKTPEADLAVSITGHLGPGAPASLDGIAFVGWCFRPATSPAAVTVERLQLAAASRGERQRDAAKAALQIALDALAEAE